jgi:uncharacterized protein (DUF362 family)
MGSLHLPMKFLYKPFGILAGVISARIAATIFKALWARIDAEDPPKPTTEAATFPKVLSAAVLEAATSAGVGAVVDRAGARACYHLTGIWPGEQHAGE